MTSPLISEILAAARRPVLSYEFFPPKTKDRLDQLKRVAEELKPTRPDFVTVTHGAGGSSQGRTLEACAHLRSAGFAVVMPHLTCIGASREELCETIDAYYEEGYRNIMCLRGDPPRGESHFQKHPDGLAHANELIALVKKRHPDICCGAAGYPEVHQEALSPESDLLYLKSKVEAGASFITTQLFFDNRAYAGFVKKCREWGIAAPVVPGLLPPTSLKQIQRMAGMCGASLPPPLVTHLMEAGEDRTKAKSVGIEWTVKQVRGLLERGVSGIHLYVLNQSGVALAPALTACFKEYT